jgi:hydrogenase maturation protein HypF
LEAHVHRKAFFIRGIVQGVGFRPFVRNLAVRLQLTGFVRNVNGLVEIEVQGTPSDLDAFADTLLREPPPLAQIEDVACESRPLCLETGFRIESSASTAIDSVFLSPDVATCDDCLRELFDPSNSRYLYPFLNCTNCGPRLTIVTGFPYDRSRTTMASFPMCAECRAEYEDPADRRFHAQPTACARCGPRLELRDGGGRPMATADPIDAFTAAIRRGAIGALKGLGGFHLVCDAGSEAAVAELRHRKQRDEKPFAVMVADVAVAEALCEVERSERDLLVSAARPIVLLRKRCRTPGVVEGVAPGSPSLGVMLPYTPLHHLLLRATGGLVLVMTSGNQADEPIATDNDDAVERLNGIADLFLLHDRPIHVRCDDSVTRIACGIEMPVRRSRGYAPRPIRLPIRAPMPILAVGGQLKATFALGRDEQAFVSHHLGDLDHFAAYQAFERDIELYERLFGFRPACIVHDLHPDYGSTGYARRRAERSGERLLAVQHHHAHIASCMAENGLTGSVIGVAFDGTGYGIDETIWGGEFLVGEYGGFRRAGHLRTVGMPGGDQAIKEPWRMAFAHLADANIDEPRLRARLLPHDIRAIEQMLQRGFRTPMTSSAGRLFDAVSSLASVVDVARYEGQAAIQLEALAVSVPTAEPFPFALEQAPDKPDSPIVVDTRPVIAAIVRCIAEGAAASLIARRFHDTLVEIVGQVCRRLRKETTLDRVVLSGGVFLNAILTRETISRLSADGFRVYRHRQVPPGDGGLSLGQLAIASAMMGAAEGGPDVSRDSRQGGRNLS